jgi:photosystem II stability/assembly factor-like uncharacterized protein
MKQKYIIQLFLLIFSLSAVSIGAPWYSVEPRVTDKSLKVIYFCDSLNGWAVGNDGAIIHSSDGGVKWNLQTSGVSDTLLDVYFSNASNGWAAGRNGCVLHTIDGGATWTKLLKRTDYDLIKVHSNGDTDIVFSNYNNVYESFDGGTMWTGISMGVASELNDVIFFNMKNIVVCGYQGVYKSVDSLTSWQQITLNSIHNLTDNWYICFLNLDTGWVYNYYGLYFTSNGGQTWDSLSDPKSSFGSLSWYFGPAFIDNLKGYMIKYSGAPSSLLKTTDGGHNWSIDSTFAPTTDYLPVFYLDKWNNGWCIGDFGAIYTNKVNNNSGIKRKIINSDLNACQKIQINKSNVMVPLLKNTDKILIYNCKGKLVSNYVVSQWYYGKEMFPVSLEKLSSGLYFLTLKNDITIQKTFKLIKK